MKILSHTKFIALLSLFLILMPSSMGQNKSDQDEFNAWMKKRNQAFQDYRSKIDREFGQFLTERWEAYNSYAAERAFIKPKPKKLPEIAKPAPVLPPKLEKVPPKAPATEPIKPKVEQPQKGVPDRSKPKDEPKPEVEKPNEKTKPVNPDLGPKTSIQLPKVPFPVVPPVVIAPVAPPKKTEETVSLDFFGQGLKIVAPLKFVKADISSRPSSKNIARSWDELAKNTDPAFISKLRRMANYLGLNDWGFAMMTQQMALAIHKDYTKANILTWFILIKAGLDVKLGYSGNNLYIMLHSETDIYGKSYFRIGSANKKYYPVMDFKNSNNEEIKTLTTYKKDYPDKINGVDFSMVRTPNLKNTKPFEKKLSLKIDNYTIDTNLIVNGNLLDFQATMPFTDYNIYYMSEASPDLQKSIDNMVKALVGNLEGIDRLNALLRLVQKASDYETDTKQFGKEVIMYPDQFFFYPFTDCDDRVSLFSYLVRKYTDYKIIALLYEGHITTGVQIPGVSGDSVQYKRSKYVIADPTYINASVGMAMSSYKNSKPRKIIPLN